MQYRLPACLLYRLSEYFESLPRRCRFYRAMRSDLDTAYATLLASDEAWQPKFSGYARKFRCFLFLRASRFARADGRDNLCSSALTTIREILMNDAALRRLIKYRR